MRKTLAAVVTGQLADTPTRGLDISRTGQLADWTTRGLADAAKKESKTRKVADGIREMSSPRVVQSTRCQSASWRIRELFSNRCSSLII